MPALGQTKDRAGNPQVFQGNRDDKAVGSNVDVTLDVGSAYDDNLPTTALAQLAASTFQAEGIYATLSPQVDFRVNGDRIRLNLSASSDVRNYADLHRILVMDHFFGGGVTAQLTQQTTASFSQTVTYSPTYLNGLFATAAAPAGALVPPDANSTINVQRSYTYGTTAALTTNLTPRAAASFNANWRYNDYIGENVLYPDLRSYGGGGQFSYSLSRNVRLQLGYRFTDTQTVGTAQTTEHDLTIGLQYDLPLSRTRKTAIAFNLGPTRATGFVPTEGGQELRGQYRLTSDASMTYNIGRSWNARGSFHRGMGFIEGLPGPTYANGFTASFDGFLNRRSDLSLSAGYSAGESALIGAPSPFSTYTGNARVRIALGRTWATYVQYLYYYYNFSESFLLPTGVPRGLSRGSIRAGLTLWIPVRHR
jgi:hypothetical protein